MTQQADRMRTHRRVFAAPGSSHDRVIGILRVALPSIIGALTAYMVLAPLTQRGEVSFLLDKDTVEIAKERMRVSKALYRGEDNKGQPFSLQAGSAVQQTSDVPVVELSDLEARILLSNGPAALIANRGEYNMETDLVDILGPIQFNSAGGYRLTTRDVAVDLNKRTLKSKGRVQGRIPAGTFSADTLEADLNDRRVVLEGRARLRMTPGAMNNESMGF